VHFFPGKERILFVACALPFIAPFYRTSTRARLFRSISTRGNDCISKRSRDSECESDRDGLGLSGYGAKFRMKMFSVRLDFIVAKGEETDKREADE